MSYNVVFFCTEYSPFLKIDNKFCILVKMNYFLWGTFYFLLKSDTKMDESDYLTADKEERNEYILKCREFFSKIILEVQVLLFYYLLL